MYCFKAGWKKLINVNARPAEKVQLLIKLVKTSAPLMIDFCFGDQANLKTHFMDTDAILNIFTQAGNDKASCLFPNLPRDPHIKATWMELPDTLFITAYCTPDDARIFVSSSPHSRRFLDAVDTIFCAVRSTIYSA